MEKAKDKKNMIIIILLITLIVVIATSALIITNTIDLKGLMGNSTVEVDDKCDRGYTLSSDKQSCEKVETSYIEAEYDSSTKEYYCLPDMLTILSDDSKIDEQYEYIEDEQGNLSCKYTKITTVPLN